MARYFWDEKSMRSDLKKLEKIIELENDPMEKARLNLCYDMINSSIFSNFVMPQINIPLKKNIHSMFGTFLADQRFYSLVEVYLIALENNCDLFNETHNNMDLIKESKTHLSREKAVSICYDFYRGLDGELFKYFEPFYNNRHSHLKFTPHKEKTLPTIRGKMYYLYGLDKSYVEIVGSNDPQMALTLIHESGHVIDTRYNNYAYLVESFFAEVSSLFMELIAMYQKVGEFDDLFYHKNIIERMSSIFVDAEMANNIDLLMGVYKENGYKIDRDFYKKAREEHCFTKKEIIESLTPENMDDIVYPISFSLALFFFNMYRYNKKEALKEFKKFLATEDRDTYIPLMLSNELSLTISEELKTILHTSNDAFQKELSLNKKQ